MKKNDLKGWNYIVYILIKNNFEKKPFYLKDLYAFESYFKMVYPINLHVKAKLRQTLQKLRDKGLLEFLSKSHYKLTFNEEINLANEKDEFELIYLLSNESIPGWIKIGRTNSIERRLKDLYNTSIPLPFKVEKKIEITSHQKSITLEKSIHNIIDTINPNLRKNTEANRREFFKLTPEEGKRIFELISQIMKLDQKTH